MKLRVLHRTTYHYGESVRESFNEARLRPVSDEDQECKNFLLKILPPTRLSHYQDFYNNHVSVFEISEPHNRLVIEAHSTVVTNSTRRITPDLATTPLADMGACARMIRCYDFTQPSHYVTLSPDVWKLSLDITAGIPDVWQAAQAIQNFIHRNFSYAPATTTVHTHMSEVMAIRRGVCQDFAHAMIGLCRVLGIPARYVSGYLYNGPADQLRGAQATHAWVDVFLPDHGWHGLDPTNGMQVDERYIKIAVGRDYADVSPVRGTYRGTGNRQLSVDVLVSSLD